MRRPVVVVFVCHSVRFWPNLLKRFVSALATLASWLVKVVSRYETFSISCAYEFERFKSLVCKLILCSSRILKWVVPEWLP